MCWPCRARCWNDCGKTALRCQDPLLARPGLSGGCTDCGSHPSPRTRRAQGRSGQRALQLFQRVSIPSPEQRLKAYPHRDVHALRQRAMIALPWPAIRRCCSRTNPPPQHWTPRCRSRYCQLLRELQRELGLGVSCDARHRRRRGSGRPHCCDVRRPHRGRGHGRAADPQPAPPLHHGTAAEIRSHGAMERGQPLQTIGGAPPDLTAIPPGCAFAPRCRQQGCLPAGHAQPGHAGARSHGPLHPHRCLGRAGAPTAGGLTRVDAAGAPPCVSLWALHAPCR